MNFPTVSSSSCTAKKLLLSSTFSDLTSTSLSAVEKHFLLTFNCVYLMLGRIWKEEGTEFETFVTLIIFSVKPWNFSNLKFSSLQKKILLSF